MFIWGVSGDEKLLLFLCQLLLFTFFFPFQRPCSGSAASVTSQYPGIIESHEEFRFVERLIPPTQVPKPPKHTGVTPSGWIPPKGLFIRNNGVEEKGMMGGIGGGGGGGEALPSVIR